jgi:hypothetical protein
LTQKGSRYQAEEGNFIVRKADGFIMGEGICLGDADSIDNYKEEPYTEESYKEFYASIGVDIEKEKESKKDRKSRDLNF